MPVPKTFLYAPWRHGGWYVSNVCYPSGAVGCVSRNYPDRKWRIVCDPRGDDRPTFKSRDEAAAAEWELARQEREANPFDIEVQHQQVWGPVKYYPDVDAALADLPRVRALWNRDGQTHAVRIKGPDGVVDEGASLAA